MGVSLIIAPEKLTVGKDAGKLTMRVGARGSTSPGAIALLQDMLPFLVIKRRQVEAFLTDYEDAHLGVGKGNKPPLRVSL
jgi:hypothetical protein